MSNQPPEDSSQPPYGQQPPFGQPYGGQQGHSQYPRYPQYPGGGDPYAELLHEPEFHLDIHGRRPQRRWTVLIRLILAIPQLIILYILLLAGFFVVIAGWFAALFTGRLPAGIRRFLIGVLTYQARVHGYLLLLVDEYPPFAFEAPSHPIQLVAPEPTRLNPAAVFFRLILMVPGWIVTWVVGEGAAVVSFFVWIIMLFTGVQPEAAFGAASAALRFETRFTAFSGMLTPTQPKGLFGDVPAVVGESERHSPTRPLFLSANARMLMVVMIVIGVIAAIVNSVVNSDNSSSYSGKAPYTVSQVGPYRPNPAAAASW